MVIKLIPFIIIIIVIIVIIIIIIIIVIIIIIILRKKHSSDYYFMLVIYNKPCLGPTLHSCASVHPSSIFSLLHRVFSRHDKLMCRLQWWGKSGQKRISFQYFKLFI